MNSAVLSSEEIIASLCEQVRQHPVILPRGRGTKPALSSLPASSPTGDVHLLDLSSLRGILEYEPDEFTLTALAGTPLTEIIEELARNDQYLPFDPPLADHGATLGGTVAAGLSGSGRYRYGGVRDFLIGVRFIDGQGRLIRGGGKVVKNAAGFDLPKLMVGSLGRLGVLVELTFKVFPRPLARQTVCILCEDLETAVDTMTRLSREDWGCEAVDLEPNGQLWLRFAGDPKALEAQSDLLRQTMQHDIQTGDIQTVDQPPFPAPEPESPAVSALDPWGAWSEFRSNRSRPSSTKQSDLSWIKVPITPRRILPLDDELAAASKPKRPEKRRRYSVGGQLLWLSWPTTELDTLDGLLKEHHLNGLNLRPAGSPFVVGRSLRNPFLDRTRHALDPAGRFLPFP